MKYKKIVIFAEKEKHPIKYMKKYILDLRVKAVEHPREGYALLKLTNENGELPEMLPGQFVEVKIDGAEGTFLRRPISINRFSCIHNELWLLVHAVGDGTRKMYHMHEGDTLNCVLPLGNGFSTQHAAGSKVLLVGGGVGTAPLLAYGEYLKERGVTPVFLLGGRSAKDLMQLDLFEQMGDVHVTTEDASMGEKGFVTQHSILSQEHFDAIATCGPKPMMMAVAGYAQKNNIPCEASLENLMACGLGACLCCVEKTSDGHNVCVCKEGPVFNTEKLQWHNLK